MKNEEMAFLHSAFFILIFAGAAPKCREARDRLTGRAPRSLAGANFTSMAGEPGMGLNVSRRDVF